MKPISNFPVWVNGVYISAEQFYLHVNFDNLIDQAIFYFSLNDIIGNRLTEGNITMSGQDYLAWNGSNDYAWEWAAKTLGLTII